MNYIYLKNNQYHYVTLNSEFGVFCTMDNQLYPLRFDDLQGQYMIYTDHTNSGNIPKTLSLKRFNKTFQSENITAQSVHYQIAGRIINPEFVIDIDPTSGQSLQIQIFNNESQSYTKTLYYDPVTYGHINHFVVIPYSFYTTNIRIIPEFTGTITVHVTADKLLQ